MLEGGITINKIIDYKEKIFDSIKHIDENGVEYWEARELMPLLEYNKWENFHKVIKKAIISCESSNNNILDHFPEFRKPIAGGKGNIQNVIDYHLSRYACYLIVQNANPKKKSVALGQTYFAVQTRKMEITEEEYAKLSEDGKRLYTRINVNNKNKKLFYTAKKSGVKNFGKFNNYGYMGLYNGETAQDISKRKKLTKNEDILDWMGSTELAANLFRITQTDEVLKNNNIKGEENSCNTHHKVGKAIRDTIIKVGGTTPEKLPTPKKSVKELEIEEIQKLKDKKHKEKEG